MKCLSGSARCPRAEADSSSSQSSPNIAINSIFLAIAALSLVFLIGVSAYTRCVRRIPPESRRLGFSVLLGLTALLQIAAYSSQLTRHASSSAGLVLSTISPAFLVIAIPFAIRPTITLLGAEHSPLKKHLFMATTTSLTLTSLLPQGFGLAFSLSSSSSSSSDAATSFFGLGSHGTNDLVAAGHYLAASGLALQALSLGLCLAVLGATGWRARAAHRAFGYTTFHRLRGYVGLARGDRCWLVALPSSAACLAAWSALRAARFARAPGSAAAGYFDPWSGDAKMLAAEGVLLAAAVGAMAVFHPELCLSAVGASGCRGGRGERAAAAGDSDDGDVEAGLVRYVVVAKADQRRSIGSHSRSGSNSSASSADREARAIMMPDGAELDGHPALASRESRHFLEELDLGQDISSWYQEEEERRVLVLEQRPMWH